MPEARWPIARLATSAAVVAVALTLPAVGQADQLSLQMRPGYRGSHTTVRDSAGRSQHTESHHLVGLYGLSLSRELFPLLSFDAGANLDDQRNLKSVGEQAPIDSRTSLVYGTLKLSNRQFGATAGYSRGQRSSFPVTGQATSFVNERLGATGQLAPEGMPNLSLRLDRMHTFDPDRASHDSTVRSAQLNLDYTTLEQARLRYDLSYTNPRDELTRTESSTIGHAARVGYGDRLWRGRMTVAADYALSVQSTRIELAGPAGTLAAQRYPVAGLSGLVSFPDDPVETDLAANPVLIDGDTTVGASIDIGYGPTVDGDTSLRELGARFADTGEEIDMVYVWTDRWLPAEIAGHLTWTAYASDDNDRWTPIALAGPVAYAQFHDRFEIPIAASTARFLKLTVAPLPAAATADAAFASIQITELQFFEVEAASYADRRSTSAYSRLSASTSTRLHAREDLSHVFSANVTRQHTPALATRWSLSNGLRYGRRVGAARLGTHIVREDSDDGGGHRSAWMYGANATAKPLQTLYGAVAYSGRRERERRALQTTNGVSASGRAALYRGISLLANFGYQLGRDADGRRRSGRSAALSTSLHPSSKLSFTGSYGYSRTAVHDDDARLTENVSSRAVATAAARPFPVLAINASISAVRRPGHPQRVLASYGGSFSPLPGGALQLTASYGTSLDNASDSIQRRGLVGLRLIVRAGWYLDGNYTYLAATSLLGERRSHVATATLTGRL